ncbi:periplasmic heavy metal sensor [Govanella unica]|uniref:Periplasmic heavy metal sensor n=1 Tax=Govanella unica TaxID=2975056 RepID=A0A9X3Z863_9PROT|nr:periplasmic heavy metal sensor [Govania unica]MDA5194704.1 periplasmic heavy metal sensor [Govania unica]
MSPDIRTEQLPKKSSALKWPLVASLAVNLFLGGILIGHVYSEGLSHFFKQSRPTPYMTQDLSPDARAVAKTVFAAHAPRVHELWKELREERKILQNRFSAEDFDEAEAQKALAEMGRLDSLIQAEFHKATLEIARQLPPEERRKLNLRWKREQREHHPGKGSCGKDEPPARPGGGA